MTQAILYAAIVVSGIILGANIYTSAVDAPIWGSAAPASFETARAYFATRNPGTFFRVASPLSQVLSLGLLVATWKMGGAARQLAGAALLLGLLADGMTFAYFYPRNEIMFVQPVNVEAMSRAWREWSAMNHVRSLLVLSALVCQLNLLARAAVWAR